MSMEKHALKNIPGLGIWLSITANLFLVLAYLSVKKIIHEKNAFTVAFLQSLLQFSLMLPLLCYRRISLKTCKEERVFLLVCAVCNCLYLFSFNYSFVFMSASDSSAICMSYPVIVTLIAPSLLNEPFKKIYVFNAALSISGVLIVVRPSFLFDKNETTAASDFRFFGIALCIVAVISLTAISIISRKLQETSTWICSTLYPLTTALLVGVLCFTIEGVQLPKCGLDSWLLPLSSAFMSVGFVLFYAAFRYEEAGPLAVVGTVEIPFVLIVESIVFQSLPSWTTCLGAFMVLFGVLLTALSKWEDGKQAIANKIRCCNKNEETTEDKRYKIKNPEKDRDVEKTKNVFTITSSFTES